MYEYSVQDLAPQLASRRHKCSCVADAAVLLMLLCRLVLLVVCPIAMQVVYLWVLRLDVLGCAPY
jgi:hypothetical protein